MDYPPLTVGIPAYNHERFIDETLEAVAAQTYPKLELVVIDDGSTDRTYERIERFVERHAERFAWVHAATRPNKGVARTLNEIFEICRTEWIFVCSSDDILYPHRLATQYRAIREWNEPELAMVWSAVDWIDESGRPLPSPPVKYPAHGINRQGYLDFLMVNTVYGGAPAFRTKAILDCGGFEPGLPFEDWNMWLKLAVRYPIGFVDGIASKYRVHGGNMSSPEQFPLMLYGILITMADFLAEHSESVPVEGQRNCLRKNLLRTFRWARRARPLALPAIAADIALSNFRDPRPGKFFDLAELMERSFRGDAARRYAGFVAERRRK